MRGAALVYTSMALGQRATSLLLLPFVTRAMSQSDYGATSVLAAIGLLAATVLGGPLEPGVLRASAKKQDDASLRVARVWLGLIAPSTSLAAGLVLFLAGVEVFGMDSRLLGIEIAAAGLTLFATSYSLPFLRGRYELGGFVTIAGTTIVLQLTTKMLFVVVFGWGPLGWVISDLVVGSLVMVIALFVTPARVTSIGKSDVRASWAFAGPLVPHVFANWMLVNGTRPVLAVFLPLDEVAIYAAAFSAASVGQLIVNEVGRVAAVQYARDGGNFPSDNLLRTMRMQVGIAALLPFVILLLLPVYVGVILPQEYAAVSGALAILACVPLILGIYGMPMNIMIQTFGVTRWAWVTSSIGALLTVIGSSILGGIFGANGAAAANVICYVGMLVCAFILVRLLGIRVPWYRGGLRPLRLSFYLLVLTAASVSLIVLCDLLIWQVVTAGVAGAVAFFVIGSGLVKGKV